MARMYPANIDPDTQSNAERVLFDRFRTQLTDEHWVFHSVAWQAMTSGGRRRDGEADFLIVHPRNGVLVLEVKGGHIIRNRKRGAWFSIDGRGRPHEIKDPLKQAMTSKYCFIDLLAELTGHAKGRINIGHAAAFPDVYVTDELLSPDMPPEILMGQNHLSDVAAWTRDVLDYYRGTEDRGRTAPGGDVLRKLVELMGKTVYLKPAMWGQIQLEKEQQAELTRQQFLLLDMLNRRNRALVAGCAGSGKTMLAAEKAARLADSGFETLLTCYNKGLAAFLRDRLGERPRLKVQHFHELGFELADRAGTLPDKYEYDNTFFSETLPESMLAALDADTESRYDAIIVDEGQDFEDAWWIPLQSMLSEPDEGIFYIFYDEAQSLYNEEMAFPVAEEPYLLDINCRNTKRIQGVVGRFAEVEMRSPEKAVTGRPVELVRCSAGEGPVAVVTPVIERLVDEEHVPLRNIVLLTPLSSGNERSEVWNHARVGRFALTKSREAGDGEIRCGTIHGFKGCEADVVVLLEPEKWLDDESRDALMYVATSRARHHLVVVLGHQADDGLRASLN